MQIFIQMFALVLSTVTPTGGNQAGGYPTGSTVSIGWDGEPISNTVDVLLWDGYTSSMTPLIEAQPWSSLGVDWTIPGSIAPGNRYRFVIRDATNHKHFQMSAGWVQLGMPQPTQVQEEGPDKGLDLRVSPFPASDDVVVSWANRDVEFIQLVDVHHRVVLETRVPRGASSTMINTQDLGSGLVYVKVFNTSGAVASVPLMISR